jgi:hypothetical protein
MNIFPKCMIIQEVLGRTNRLLSLIRHGPHWKRRVQQFFSCRIWGSHSGSCEEYHLLWYNASTCSHAGFLLNLFFRPWRWRRYVSPKRRFTLNGLHGVISQKIVLFYYSIVARVYVTAVTFLPSHCLATIGGFLPSRCVATIRGFFLSCCLVTTGGYTDTHRQQRDLISLLVFL